MSATVGAVAVVNATVGSDYSGVLRESHNLQNREEHVRLRSLFAVGLYVFSGPPARTSAVDVVLLSGV